MTILSKRLQQGVFSALSSQNRWAGSGGNSGLMALTAATVSTLNISVNITTAVYTTINSQTFNLSRPSNLFIWTSAVSGNQIAGAAGITMGVQLDGIFPGSSNMGLALQGDIATNAAATTIGPFTFTYVWTGVGVGAHTLALVAKTTAGTTWQCGGSPNFFILGGN